jgi:copper transport protein
MLALIIVLLLWTRRNIQSGARYPVIASGLQRFSILAVLSVALLIFTGTANTIIELGQFSDLFNTGYGRALLAKLLLLLPLLGIAASNAYLVRPDLVEATENTGVRNRTAVLAELEGQLNHRMRLELGVAVLVLAVVALLVQLTPTRGRLETPGGTSVLTAEGGGIQATLEVDPNQPGNNTFSVYLTGRVDLVESLRLEFVQPDGFSGQSRLDLEPSNPPTFYVGQGPYLSSPGEWSVILNIRVIAGNDLRLSYTLDVQDPSGAASTLRTGGSFASPIPLSATTTALLVLSGIASVAIVVGSMSRPGLPEGYLGWLTAELAYRLAPFNVRPVYTLGALVIMGLVLGYVISNHLHSPLTPEEATRNNPVPDDAESIARGRMLFQNNCTICHGESGKGDGPAAATLSIPPANLYDHIPYHPDTFFFNVISNGLSGIMPGFEGQISEEDRWNILNYLRATFSATPAQQ